MKVWFCNQTLSWDLDRRHGVLFASDRAPKLKTHETVGEVVLGHLIVHYRKPNVVAISQATQNGRHYGYMSGDHAADYSSGWLVSTNYFELSKPLHPQPFTASLLKYYETAGPLTRKGGFRTGYLFPFSEGALRVILEQVEEQLPAWLLRLDPVKR